MKLKTSIAITLGRLANAILAKRGGGSSFPGKLAEKIDKDILGGGIIKIGDKIIDGSIRRELDNWKKS